MKIQCNQFYHIYMNANKKEDFFKKPSTNFQYCYPYQVQL